MRKSILFLAFVLVALCKSNGQTNFYVELSGNYSLISKSEYVGYLPTPIGVLPIKMPFEITENYNTKPGVNLGFGFDKKVQDRVWVNSGLNLSFHQYKQNIKVKAINLLEGTEFSDVIDKDWLQKQMEDFVMDNMGKTKTLYASVPVRVKYELIPERFRIGVGATNYFMVYSNQIKQKTVEFANGYKLEEYEDTSSNGLNNYQLNGNIQLEYKIAKSLWLQANYNHGFLNIYDNAQKSTSKYRTIDLGLKYDL